MNSMQTTSTIRTLIYATLLSLLFAVAFSVVSPKMTSALSGSDFDAGNIIDNAVFYDDDAITVTQIQQFLNSQVPVCDTNGTKIYRGSQTRSEYGASRGNPAPYTCLKNYTENVGAVTYGGSDLCTKSISGGTKTAARIIYDVGQACGINPQVLLVLIQKEQSLITDDWPWENQYNKATGYGCPDTAPCNELYFGFFNQVHQAAKAFRRYEANPNSYNYKAQRNNSLRYHPNVSCGSSNVFIQNQATANLYIYTPYQPNQAALNNLYGSGDSCSAYGNRNFWRIFHDWFGSTRAAEQIVGMSRPRWMTVSSPVFKINLASGQPVDAEIAAGTSFYFDDKVTIGGTLYLRTREDSQTSSPIVIPYTELVEYTPQYSVVSNERWMRVRKPLRAVQTATEAPVGQTYQAGDLVYIKTKTSLGGVLYVRTAESSDNSEDQVLRFSLLEDVAEQPTTTSFSTPRWMTPKRTTIIVDIQTGERIRQISTSEPAIFFDSKLSFNGFLFVTGPSLTTESEYVGLNFSDLKNIEPSYQPMLRPRSLKLSEPGAKINTVTSTPVSQVYNTGRVITFSHKIVLGGELYLQTTHDAIRNNDKIIPFSQLEEL